MPNRPGTDGYSPTVPSMLDLVRLSPRRLFPPGGVELFRQIALLTEMSQGHEVLDVACGKGVSLEYFVREFGVQASGVDVDPGMIELAEAHARDEGLGERLQFQSGRSDALPYRDEIFDVAVGEIGLANHCPPEDAIRELARVTKPGGFVVLLQLAWKAPVDEDRRGVLADHLGARPLMVVEWKRLLRESGVRALHTEDWSDDETAFRPVAVKPFPDFAELFSLPEKLGILRRAWSRWGWTGVRAVLAREREVHQLLTRERILGLDLLKGRKGGAEGEAGRPVEPQTAGANRVVPPQTEAPAVEPSEPEAGAETDTGADLPDSDDATEAEGEPETAGLPLFGGDEGKK